MTFGSFALKASALLGLAAFVLALAWACGARGLEKLARAAYHGMTLGLVVASAELAYALVMHDFRFGYVAAHTSRDLALLYRVSAFWAGQEGTLLLWALMGALAGYFLWRRRAWQRAWSVAFYLPTIGWLLAAMLLPSGDPLRLAQTVAPDGAGLNPLLQDPWMAAHPPLVFAGYVACTLPAVLAAVALWTGDRRAWIAPGLRWSLAATVLLGAGIVVGGFWAYEVLGWGGYWGWDPVENASLVPWLLVVALVHGLLVERFDGALRRLNLGLALAGYLTVLYATFLTRSGVLAEVSVHSFPRSGLYALLLGTLIVALLASTALFARGAKDAGAALRPGLSLAFLMAAGLAALVMSAALVLLGTSWPLLAFWADRRVAPGPDFYNAANLPLAVGLLLLLGIAPLKAGAAVSPRVGRRLLAIAAVCALVALAAGQFGISGWRATPLLFAALLALGANGLRLLEALRRGWLQAGAAAAHLGLALIFAGVVGSGWGTVEQRVRLVPGQPVEALGTELVFLGHVPGSEPQDRWALEVRSDRRARRAEVAVFRLPGERERFMHRPAILRGASGDLYIAPLALERTPVEATLHLARGDAVRYGDASLTFAGFLTESDAQGHFTVRAAVQVERGSERATLRLPVHARPGGGLEGEPVETALIPGATLTLAGMSVERGVVRVSVEHPGAPPQPVLTVSVSRKPLMGLLWLGASLLLAGSALAGVRRALERARPAYPAAKRGRRVFPKTLRRAS